MNQKKSTKILMILIIIILIIILIGGVAFAYLATDIFRSEKELFFKYITQMGDSEKGLIDNQLKQYFEKRKNTPYNDEGNFSVNITAENGQEQFKNVNDFNISFSGQVDTLNSKAEQNISLNYSDEVNFPINYKQIENAIGLQTKYVGSKFITVETDKLNNLTDESDISLEIDTSRIENIAQVELTDEQKNYIKNTYKEVLNAQLPEEKFSKVEEAEAKGYRLSLASEELKNILVQILETLKNDQTTLGIINQYLATQEDYDEISTNNIDDLIESINDEEWDEQNLEITVYSKNRTTSKIKISTNDGSFNIEKIKENDKLKILFYFEPTEESTGRVTLAATFEGLEAMQNVKEVYEIELQYEQQPGILDQALKASSANQVQEEEEQIGLMINETIIEKSSNVGNSSSAITKENLEKVKNNDSFYEDMEIENISDNEIQIEFIDTGDIFVINNEGEIISKPEETNNDEDTTTASGVIQYKYQLENNINFTDSVNIEEFTNENSMILTDRESEEVYNFLNAVVERITQVNKQQMEELGLEESENPIQYLIPSLGIFSMSNDIINETSMSEAEINTFNNGFEMYTGTNQQVQTVKGLLSTISLNNESMEDDRKITEINFNGEEYEATEENITFIKEDLDTEKNYRIEFEKDQDTGIIYRVVINER